MSSGCEWPTSVEPQFQRLYLCVAIREKFATALSTVADILRLIDAEPLTCVGWIRRRNQPALILKNKTSSHRHVGDPDVGPFAVIAWR